MGIEITCYKTWLSIVALSGSAVDKAASSEAVSMIGTCSSGPVQVSCHQSRLFSASSASHFLALLEMYLSLLLLSSPSPLRTRSTAIDSDIGQRRKGKDRSQKN